MSFSFRAWPFPSTKTNKHILKCSKFGLIAYAMNNNVSIFVEDFGNFTPLLMWSPFQHQITALGWYDASKTMNTSVPILAVASLSGRLEIFDCRSRMPILKMHVNLNHQSNSLNIIYNTALADNDYVTSITWSQFSSSTFYVGTKNGRLICFEITIGQIVKCKVEWELLFNFQIDHICLEPQFGERCAIASKQGSLATIQNVNKYQEGKPPKASPNVVTLSNNTDSIRQVNFYPTSTDFIILVTTSTSLLYSISNCCIAPLLTLPGIRRFHVLPDSGNLSLVVRDDSVEIWKNIDGNNEMLSEISLATGPRYANQREILSSDMMGSRLILITSKMWLTTVELKASKKLFITHRVKLLDSKPLSFSYANESITFATAKGNVLISETSNPNFIAQMALDISKPQKPSEKVVENVNNLNAQQSNKNILNEQSSSSSKESSEKVPSISPSPHIEFVTKIHVSKSQFFRVSRPRGHTEAVQKSKVHNSILQSCASSSSLFLDSLGKSNQGEEEILDKTIIHDKHQKKVSTSMSISQLNLIKIKRRLSFDPSEITVRNTILSSLVNEKIKTIPKDSSSAIQVSRPQASKPQPLSPSKEQRNQPDATKQSNRIPTPKSSESSCGLSSSENYTNFQKDDATGSTRVIPKNKFGNNCSIMWNYKIADDVKIEHIEWISSTRVLAYTLSKSTSKKDDEDERRGSNGAVSDSSDSQDSTNLLDLTQQFSGKSFIYLIDLKYHRISRIFNNAEINITAIAFSSNKQFFSVTINGCIVVLFKNKPQPKQINLFTFQKIVFTSFISHYLTIIDMNGEIRFISISEKDEISKEKVRRLKMKKDYGSITCVCSKKNLIYIGTSTGYILSFELTTMKTFENYQIKPSIVSFKSGPSGSFLVESHKEKMITIDSDGEATKLPTNIKCAILTSPTILLIRRKKQNAVEVFQTIGQFSSSYPKASYRCPLMMPTNRWIQSLEKEESIDQTTLINYGMPHVAEFLDARKWPNYVYEKRSFLRDIIMTTPELWKTSYRLSIFLGEFDKAHEIIAANSNSSNANENWAINMMKSVLFNNDKLISNEMNIEGILFAAKSLINFGFIDDGLDILLTSGLWIDAVKLLIGLGRIHTAAIITRVYHDEKSLNVVKEVADYLFKLPNLVSYGMKMLCEAGLENDAILQLKNIKQLYSSYVLRMVTDNE